MLPASRRYWECVSVGVAPWAMTIPDTEKKILHTAILKHVEKGATLYTDQYRGYHGIKGMGLPP